MLNMELKNKGISRSLKNKIIEAWKEETLQYEEFISPDAYRFYTPELTPEKMEFMPEAKKGDSRITDGQWNCICNQLDKSNMNKDFCDLIREIARHLLFNQADWLIKELNKMLYPVTDNQRAAIIDMSTKLNITVNVDVHTYREASDLIQDLKQKIYELEAERLTDKQVEQLQNWHYQCTRRYIKKEVIDLIKPEHFPDLRKKYAQLLPKEKAIIKAEKDEEIKRAAKLKEALKNYDKKYHESEAKENSYNGFEYPYDDYFDDALGW